MIPTRIMNTNFLIVPCDKNDLWLCFVFFLLFFSHSLLIEIILCTFFFLWFCRNRKFSSAKFNAKHKPEFNFAGTIYSSAITEECNNSQFSWKFNNNSITTADGKHSFVFFSLSFSNFDAFSGRF